MDKRNPREAETMDNADGGAAFRIAQRELTKVALGLAKGRKDSEVIRCRPIGPRSYQRILHGEGNPTLQSICETGDALGFQIKIVPNKRRK